MTAVLRWDLVDPESEPVEAFGRGAVHALAIRAVGDGSVTETLSCDLVALSGGRVLRARSVSRTARNANSGSEKVIRRAITSSASMP